MRHVDAELMTPTIEYIQQYANERSNTTIMLIVGIVVSAKNIYLPVTGISFTYDNFLKSASDPSLTPSQLSRSST
jgi:c-di-AMP phosphodiesterase-like protein